MVSICKHLQYRKQQQAKEADRLGPNGERPGQEFITCSCADVASSVYGVDLSQSKQYVSWNVGTSYFRHSFYGRRNRKARWWGCGIEMQEEANAIP